MIEEKPSNVILTPLGFISYPYLSKPDVGRENSSGKYTAQLFIEKSQFKTGPGLELLKKIVEVGRTLKNNPNATLKDFKNTVYDVDTLPPEKKAKLHESVRTGYIQINAASKRAPIVKGPKQEILDVTSIERITGGDVCRFVVAVYPYKQNGGGVALGLNVVQYKEKGPNQFGGGGSGVELLNDLEVTMEDPTEGTAASPAKPADELGSLGL